MKSLIIKDFKLIKRNVKFIIIGGVLIAIVNFNRDPGDLTGASGFTIGYISLVGMISAVRTISRDKEDNSATYLFSLPISRKTYVIEKYVFVLLIGIICLVISIGLVLMLSLFAKINLVVTLYTALCLFPLMIILAEFMIPVELNFGKYTSYFILIGLIIFVLMLMYLFVYLVLTLNAVPSFLKDMSYEQLILYLYLIAIVFGFCSETISQRIIRKKEF